MGRLEELLREHSQGLEVTRNGGVHKGIEEFVTGA